MYFQSSIKIKLNPLLAGPVREIRSAANTEFFNFENEADALFCFCTQLSVLDDLLCAELLHCASASS